MQKSQIQAANQGVQVKILKFAFRGSKSNVCSTMPPLSTSRICLVFFGFLGVFFRDFVSWLGVRGWPLLFWSFLQIRANKKMILNPQLSSMSSVPCLEHRHLGYQKPRETRTIPRSTRSLPRDTQNQWRETRDVVCYHHVATKLWGVCDTWRKGLKGVPRTLCLTEVIPKTRYVTMVWQQCAGGENDMWVSGIKTHPRLGTGNWNLFTRCKFEASIICWLEFLLSWTSMRWSQTDTDDGKIGRKRMLELKVDSCNWKQKQFWSLFLWALGVDWAPLMQSRVHCFTVSILWRLRFYSPKSEEIQASLGTERVLEAQNTFINCWVYRALSAVPVSDNSQGYMSWSWDKDPRYNLYPVKGSEVRVPTTCNSAELLCNLRTTPAVLFTMHLVHWMSPKVAGRTGGILSHGTCLSQTKQQSTHAVWQASKEKFSGPTQFFRCMQKRYLLPLSTVHAAPHRTFVRRFPLSLGSVISKPLHVFQTPRQTHRTVLWRLLHKMMDLCVWKIRDLWKSYGKRVSTVYFHCKKAFSSLKSRQTWVYERFCTCSNKALYSRRYSVRDASVFSSNKAYNVSKCLSTHETCLDLHFVWLKSRSLHGYICVVNRHCLCEAGFYNPMKVKSHKAPTTGSRLPTEYCSPVRYAAPSQVFDWFLSCGWWFCKTSFAHLLRNFSVGCNGHHLTLYAVDKVFLNKPAGKLLEAGEVAGIKKPCGPSHCVWILVETCSGVMVVVPCRVNLKKNPKQTTSPQLNKQMIILQKQPPPRNGEIFFQTCKENWFSEASFLHFGVEKSFAFAQKITRNHTLCNFAQGMISESGRALENGFPSSCFISDMLKACFNSCNSPKCNACSLLSEMDSDLSRSDQGLWVPDIWIIDQWAASEWPRLPHLWYCFIPAGCRLSFSTDPHLCRFLPSRNALLFLWNQNKWASFVPR